jgi:hypothetical protein
LQATSQILAADTVERTATLIVLRDPLQKNFGLFRRVRSDGTPGNTIFNDGAACAARQLCRRPGVERLGTRFACQDNIAPELAFLDFREAARQRKLGEMALGMLITLPTAEIPDLRRRPDIAAGLAMRALQRLERQRRQFVVRCEDGVPGERSGQKIGRDGKRAQRGWTLKSDPTTCSPAAACGPAAA